MNDVGTSCPSLNESYMFAIGCGDDDFDEAMRNVNRGLEFRSVAVGGLGNNVKIITIRMDLLAIEIPSKRPFTPIIFQNRTQFR